MQYRPATSTRFWRAVSFTALAAVLSAVCYLSDSLSLGLAVKATLIGGLAVSFFASFYSLANLGQQLRRSATIEQQLARFGKTDEFDARLLQPVAGGEDADEGWNRLVAQLEQIQTLEAMERQLAKTLGSESGSAGSVLNGLGEGVAVTDLDGRLTVINDALVTLIQMEETVPASGQRFEDLLLTADESDEVAQTLSEIAGSIRPATFDVVRGVNGSSRVIRCSRRPNRNEKNAVVGHVWTLRDVTQQHLAEQAREGFVATASHELRTPLANIRAYAETLSIADGIDVDTQKEFCNTILTEATRLGRFVDELLDVTRLQAGSMPLEKSETDLERLLEELCGKLKGQFAQKKLAFKTEFPAKLPKAHVDKDKLSAALVNLLGNAAKYTPDGGEVRFRVESNAARLAFIVEDTGIGIAPEEQERVFDKFFRSDNESVRNITGSGLGLAFTREIARLHGGDVTVDSELGQGSCFTLSIPQTQGAN